MGGKEDLPINSNVNIGTNNTIFIKEHSGYTGIKIEPAAKSYHYPPDQYELNIKSLKEMKYLPYNFKDKICIGNSCIDKVNLKILKGNVGFTLNTYTAPQPFRMFTDVNFLGWSKNYGTDYVNDITSSNFVSIKSFKISDSNYMITAYELPNYGGTKTEFTSTEMADVTSIFPNGFKSFQPTSSKGNLLKKSCLSLQTVNHAPGGDNKLIQAIPCDLATDTYYIARDIDEEHTHDVDVDDIHFHEHNKSETYHFESSGGDSKLPSGKCIPESVSKGNAEEWAKEGCESERAVEYDKRVWFNESTNPGYYMLYNEEDTLPDDQELIQLCPGSLHRCE